MKQPDFDRIYKNVPAEQKQMLLDFRASHPYKEIAIHGAVWRYLSCGQGEHVLLFLPGGFVTADMWFYPITALEDRYRIIAPDAYTLQGTFAIDEVCCALVSILEAEGIEKATVIGISAGGGVAQWLIQEYPEKVEHLVLSHCGIIAPAKAEKSQRVMKLVKLLKLLPLAIIKRILLKRAAGHYPPTSQRVAFARAYMQEISANIRREMIVRFFEEGLETHRTFVYKRKVIQAWPGETLILSSQDDAVTGDAVKELQARFPGARTHLFEEGGHRTLLLFPEAYTAALKGFLDEVLSWEDLS